MPNPNSGPDPVKLNEQVKEQDATAKANQAKEEKNKEKREQSNLGEKVNNQNFAEGFTALLNLFSKTIVEPLLKGAIFGEGNKFNLGRIANQAATYPFRKAYEAWKSKPAPELPKEGLVPDTQAAPNSDLLNLNNNGPARLPTDQPTNVAGSSGDNIDVTNTNDNSALKNESPAQSPNGVGLSGDERPSEESTFGND